MITPTHNTQSNAGKLALSRAEAASVLGLSAPTIDRLVKSGQLRASRATRRPLFPIWEIDRFLRETTFATKGS